MGIYDRDYVRVGPKSLAGLGAIRIRSFNTWLIIINVAVFVIDALLVAGANVTVRVDQGVRYYDTATREQISRSRVLRYEPPKDRAGDILPLDLVIDVRNTDPPAKPSRIDVLMDAAKNPRSVIVNATQEYEVIGQTSYAVVPPLNAWLHFSTYHFFRLEVWRLVGFQFLHADVTHLLFNMLGLYFFGGLVEGYLGPKRYLAFYLTCGIFGAVAYLFLNLLGNLLPAGYSIPGLLFNDIHTPLIGASAGVFGVLMAAAFIAPAAQVLLFFVIPMRLATMAYLLTLFAAYVVITGGKNAGGQAAHLGGAAAGFYFIRHTHLLRDFFDILGPPRKKSPSTPRKGFFGPRPPSEGELDAILDKIHSKGIRSLNEAERRMLRQGTEGKRREAR